MKIIFDDERKTNRKKLVFHKPTKEEFDKALSIVDILIKKESQK